MLAVALALALGGLAIMASAPDIRLSTVKRGPRQG